MAHCPRRPRCPQTRARADLGIWTTIDRRDGSGRAGRRTSVSPSFAATIFHQTLPSGKSGHAQNAKRTLVIDTDSDRLLPQAAFGGQLRRAVGPSPAYETHGSARFEIGAVEAIDLSDRTALHCAADRHRCSMDSRHHAAAHVGVKRHVFDADQHFSAVGRRWAPGPFFEAGKLSAVGPVQGRDASTISFHLVDHFCFSS